MSVRISSDWKYRDLQTVILENEWLRVVVLPELGAKVWQITHKLSDFDLLWHHPRIHPRHLFTHAVYDDNFFGGWDELFPNDTPEVVGGEQMPDHGEVWTLPWHFEVNENDSLHLWVETPISSCRLDKWITLSPHDMSIHFRHKIKNNGSASLPFLWKLHAALKVDEHARLDMGAKRVFIEDFGPHRTGKTNSSYDWPYAQGHDMRRVPPETSKWNEFQYATEMEAGWCALTHTGRKIGLGLSFDLKVFPSCWTFATYGGWRNLNTVVLEPCTGYPVSVNQGVAQGTHQILQPAAIIDTDVVCTVYQGFREVHHIDKQGVVSGN